MFFPYRDDNPHEHFPIISLSLIIINSAIFFVFGFKADYESIIYTYGFIAGEPSVLTALTSIFLHGDILHLLGNMWFLWLFGDNVEDKFGKVTFVFFYLLGGISADLIQALTSSEVARNIPCIGASGAISAVMGAYVLLFPRAKIICVSRFGNYKISAFVFLGFWFLMQLVLGMHKSAVAGNIAYWAHIGGFLFGVAFSYLLKAYFAKSGQLLSVEEKKTEFIKNKLDVDLDRVVQEGRKKQAELKDHIKIINGYLRNKENALALEKYAEFEQKSLPGALSLENQRLIADLLLKENKKYLAMQAYIRFLSYYGRSEEAAKIECRLGLLFIRDLGSIVDGVSYLERGIRADKLESDQSLLNDARKELAKIDTLIKNKLASLIRDAGPQARFAILARIPEKKFFDQEKIFSLLYSLDKDKIKDDNSQRIGVKLAFQSRENLQNSWGIILQDLTVHELNLAISALEAASVPIAAVSQKDLHEFPLVRHINEVSLNKGSLELKSEEGKVINLAPSDIIFVYIGQVAYLSSHPSQNDYGAGLFTMEKMDEARDEENLNPAAVDFNLVFDIYTVNLCHYRLSMMNFRGTVRTGDSQARQISFEDFVEEFSSILGSAKIDEKVKILISTGTSIGLNSKDITEFNRKSMFYLHLKFFYDSLMNS